jgi:cytochrome c biogenesis protein CcmG, thiol:disulfide interchange protein DsbE
MAKRLLAIGGVVVLAACARGAATSSTCSPQIACVGAPAPAWTETSIPGPTLSSSDLRGKAVYLNFFASWCPPCNAEAPAINSIARAYGGKGLQVVGVDVLENGHKAAAFRDQHRLLYPVVVDEGSLRDQYRVNGLPVHVFIDRSGVVRNVVVGEMSPAQMQSNAERVLRR